MFIRDIFAQKKPVLSFEVFPPKKDSGLDNVISAVDELSKMPIDYMSVTYGAGGGNVGANREVCQMIKKAGTTPVTHFTVIKNTKEGIKEQLDQYLAEGVDHMLALRCPQALSASFCQAQTTPV